MSFNEWEEVYLEDVIHFNPRESLKKGTVTKRIGMNDLIEFNKKVDSFDIVKYKGGTKFRNGDTLLARITPSLENGKTAYVDILDKHEIACGSTEFIVMREIEGVTDKNFIYYLAISPKVRNVAIKSMTGTSGRQRAQRDALEKLKMKLPPLKEQKAIAKILSSLDERIETNNQINKKLEEMAQAIFKHWFVDFEFPNENGEPYKSSGGEMVESELGMIPKDWKVGKVGDLTNIVRGASPRPIKDYIVESGIPWIKISDATGSKSKYIISTKEYIKKEGKAKSRFIKPETLILSNSATPGVPMISLLNACVHDGWLIFSNYKDITMEYLYYHLLSKREHLLSLSNGSVFRNLKTDILKNNKIIIPTNKILIKGTKQFISINKTIITNTLQSNRLSIIRDTLLPKLMSGEIRVPLEKEDA